MSTDTDLHLKILNYLNTAIVLVDSSCSIQFMNQSAEVIFGISVSKGLGTDITSILTNSAADRQALENTIIDARPFTKRQATFRNAQNKNTVVDYSVTPFEQTAGESYGENGTKSQSRHLLIEIQEMNRLLKISREESIIATQDTSKQLVRGLAHEVKNPLGGIRGAAQLLSAELQEPELKEYTEVIVGEADRLRNLVDRMLGPNIPPTMQRVNVHQVLERVRLLLLAEGLGDTHLERDYDPSLPEINGDTEQLIQAALNVARNAQQALTESSVEDPKICLRTRIQRRFTLGSIQHLLVARIDIKDNGPGIDASMIDEVFYPMITDRGQGTGLGLPIAQSIINSHNGMIECTSHTGKTIFSIYLPIATNTENSGTATRMEAAS